MLICWSKCFPSNNLTILWMDWTLQKCLLLTRNWSSNHVHWMCICRHLLDTRYENYSIADKNYVMNTKIRDQMHCYVLYVKSQFFELMKTHEVLFKRYFAKSCYQVIKFDNANSVCYRLALQIFMHLYLIRRDT